MKEKIKLGIIGFGGFGKFIYRALATSALIEVTSIADSNASIGEIPKNLTFYNDWKELLKRSGDDAVLIATPPFTHFEITTNAIKAGKHVIAEKPLTIKPDEAKQIEKLAEAFDKVVMVDFLQRFNPLLASLHDLYTSQMIGRLERYFIENYAQDESLPKQHWFWNKEISGGILTEHAVHFIDLVHWFDDQPLKSVFGSFDFRNQHQEDRVAAQIHYQNGIIASHYHSFSRPNIFERTNMRFVFTNAQFDFTGWIPESGWFTMLGNEDTMQALSAFPNLNITVKKPVKLIPIRGKEHPYNHLIEGTFASSLTKEELYQQSITDIFKDFAKRINDPSHTLKVSLKDAVKAVDIAHKATLNQSITNNKSFNQE